jgi:hypothetical protein
MTDNAVMTEVTLDDVIQNTQSILSSDNKTERKVVLLYNALTNFRVEDQLFGKESDDSLEKSALVLEEASNIAYKTPDLKWTRKTVAVLCQYFSRMAQNAKINTTKIAIGLKWVNVAKRYSDWISQVGLVSEVFVGKTQLGYAAKFVATNSHHESEQQRRHAKLWYKSFQDVVHEFPNVIEARKREKANYDGTFDSYKLGVYHYVCGLGAKFLAKVTPFNSNLEKNNKIGYYRAAINHFTDAISGLDHSRPGFLANVCQDVAGSLYAIHILNGNKSSQTDMNDMVYCYKFFLRHNKPSESSDKLDLIDRIQSRLIYLERILLK